MIEEILHEFFPPSTFHRYLDLVEGVLVGALHEDGDGAGVLALLHERELVLAEHVLVNDAGVAKAVLV